VRRSGFSSVWGSFVPERDAHSFLAKVENDGDPDSCRLCHMTEGNPIHSPEARFGDVDWDADYEQRIADHGR